MLIGTQPNIQVNGPENHENDIKIRKRIAIFGVVATALLVMVYSYVSYMASKNYEKVTTEAEKAQRETQIIKENRKTSLENSSGALLSINEQWNLYTNKTLGFSLEIPKRISSGDEVIIKEHENIVYVIYKGELSKIEERIRMGKTDTEKTRGITWAFQIRDDIESDSDLNSFIKEEYGDKCMLGEKTPGLQKGTLFVRIKKVPEAPDGPEGCFVNYGTMMVYDPGIKKLVQWDLGQDVKFPLGPEYSIIADGEIRDSFKFIK